MAIQSLGDRLKKELAQIESGTVVIVEEPIQIRVMTAMRDMDKDDQFRSLVVARGMVEGTVSTAEVNAAAKDGPEAVRALADRLAA
jgi:hypothetical protein